MVSLLVKAHLKWYLLEYGLILKPVCSSLADDPGGGGGQHAARVRSGSGRSAGPAGSEERLQPSSHGF